MKTMQKRIVIVAIFVLSMLFVLLGAFTLNKQASAESAIQTDNAGLYDSFTNTDVHDGENIAYFKSIYGQEIVFHDGTELGDGYDSNYTYMEIKDDSSILKFVPEKLFKETGKTFYLGKEYGFIVDTFEIDATGELHSIVMLIDIKIEDKMISTFDHLKITIEPVFQGEFAHVTPEMDTVRCRRDMDVTDYEENYLPVIKLLPTTKEYIVSIPTTSSPGMPLKHMCDFLETSKYYLKDFSGVVSLYNEYHPNVFDESYNIQNDYGAFFTMLDYGYDAGYIKEGKFTYSETVRPVILNVASLALDIFGGAVGSAISIINDSSEFIQSIGDAIESTKVQIISENKVLDYKADFTVREHQIKRGFFNRDIYFKPQSNEGYEIALGNSNSITVDMQVNTGDATWDTRYVAALGLEAFALNEGETYSFDIDTTYSGFLDFGYGYNKETAALTIGENIETYILKNGKQDFTYDCYYGGDYTLTVNENDLILIIKEGEDVIPLTTQDNNYKFSLQAGKKYNFYVEGDNQELSQKTKFNLFFTPDQINYGENKLSLTVGGYEYFTLPVGEEIFNIQCVNQDIELNVYDEKMHSIEVYKNEDEWNFLNNSGNQYIIEFVNKSGQEYDEIDITFSNGQEVSFDEELLISLGTKKYFYFKPALSTYYRICLGNENSMNGKFVGVNAEDGGYYLEADSTYILEVTSSQSSDSSLKVEYDFQTLQISVNESINYITPKTHNQFLKFVTPFDYNFTISLPENVQFTNLLCKGEMKEISGSEYEGDFIQNQENYFVIHTDTNMSFTVQVKYEYEEINFNSLERITLNDDGKALLRCYNNEAGFYEIVSSCDYALYNSAFKEVVVNENAHLGNGYYFVLLNGTPNSMADIEFVHSGLHKNVGDKFTATQSSVYNFDVQIGKNYTLITSGNKFDKTKKIAEVIDNNGSVIAKIEAIGEISFNAPTDKIFIKVTIEIKGHSLGLRVVENNSLLSYSNDKLFISSRVNRSSIPAQQSFQIRSLSYTNEVNAVPENVQQLYEGEMVGLALTPGEEIIYAKIPAGNYYLFVEKSMEDSFLLCSKNGSAEEIPLDIVNIDSVDNDTFYKYEISLTEEEASNSIFLFYTDSNIDVTLLNQDLSLSVEFLRESETVVNRLVKGYNYEIRLVDSENNIVSLGDSRPAFRIYSGDTVISPVDGYYNFDNYDQIFVDADFYDYEVTNLTHEIYDPRVDFKFRFIDDNTNGFDEYIYVCEIISEFNGANYSEGEVSITINGTDVSKSLVENNFLNGYLLLNLSDYCYNSSFEINVEFLFKNKSKEFIVSGQYEWGENNENLVIYELNKFNSFGEETIAYIQFDNSMVSSAVRTVNIPANINFVIFAGQQNHFAKVNINITSRDENLRIMFSNFYWQYTNTGITYQGQNDIVININGHCEMRSNSNTDNSDAAINIPHLAITGQQNSQFTIRAANGLSSTGLAGSNGGNGIVVSEINININNLSVFAGDGSNGKNATQNNKTTGKGDNGGSGGDGGIALKINDTNSYILNVTNNSNVKLYGGDGGDGGDGKDGLNGGEVYQILLQKINENYNHGGNGGGGGFGGDSGVACNAEISISNIVKSDGLQGNGGDGGDGGLGGVYNTTTQKRGFGHGGDGGNGGGGYYGGNGGNGGASGEANSDTLGSSRGGNGGNGGNGTKRGGDGGRGGDGLNSTEIGPGGYGGNGGEGGYGGNGDGGDGGDGGNGGTGVTDYGAVSGVIGPAPLGGNGGRGGDGGDGGRNSNGDGGDGGDGGAGGLGVRGGNGGNGGDGHNGGIGGNGGNGGQGFSDTSVDGKASDGGDGGDGGKGGLCWSTNKYAKPGNGGHGGKGGDSGTIGHGKNGGDGGDGYIGGNGGDGTSAHIIFSNGGNGGNGGDSYGGTPSKGGAAGKGKWGKNGSAGAAGNVYDMEDYQP